MANQDWETKLENELRIVRRLLALALTQGKPKGQQIQLLSDAGMERQEFSPHFSRRLLFLSFVKSERKAECAN